MNKNLNARMTITVQSFKLNLINDQPVKAQLSYSLGKNIEIHWLYDITIDTKFVGLSYIWIFGRRRQNYNWNHFQILITFNSLQDFQAIYFRHFQIEKYHFWKVFDIPFRIIS